MEIITGRTGTAHVLAIDDAEINKMILGTAEIVLPTSLKLAAEMNGTNECRIKSGSLLMQGRLAKTRASEGYTAVPIENGTVGYYREDIIVAKYYTTTETTTDTGGNQITWTKEHIDLVAVKGTPSTTAYVEPTITTGDIDSGEIHMMKLWGVKLNGINFDSLVDFRVMATGTALDLVTSAMQNLLEIATQAENDVNASVTAGEAQIETAKTNAVAAVVAAGGVVYPVGSYYETSDGTFDPNTRFGGTWELISGRFSMPADSISNGKPSTTTPTYGGSTTGGEASVTLTNNEIPPHDHGSVSLVGSIWNVASQSNHVNLSASGICTADKEENNGYALDSHVAADGITIDATHTHDVVGGGGAHDNMPPWIAVYKWHRTA